MALLLLLLLLFSPSLNAQGRVVLLMVNGLEPVDLLQIGSSNLEILKEEGAIGLMNTRTGDMYHPQSTFLTLGTGRRAIGTGENYQPLLLENGGEAHFLEYDNLYKKNQHGSYGAIPGLLGSILKEHGLERILLTTSPGLHALFFLMDREGKAPLVYHLPRESLLEEDLLLKALSPSNLLLIEKGEEEGMDGEVLDHLLGLLREELHGDRDLFLLLSPTPSKRSLQRGSNLTPILAWGLGIEAGVITSSTTRQRALVTNLDLLPTILSFFHLPTMASLPGGVLEGLPGRMTWEGLSGLHQGLLFTANWRPTFIKVFVFFQIILLFLFFLLFLWKSPLLQSLLSLLCRYLFTIPTTFLLSGFFSGQSLPLFLFFFFLLSFSLALLFSYFSKGPLDYIILSNLTILAFILLDLFFGPYLLGRSLLGYDPIIGARFYGIGNEYMGILIGSSVMGTLALWDRYREASLFLPSLIFFLIIILFLGLPFLGANLGGTFSAIFVFSLTLLILKRSALTMKGMALSFGITFLLLAILLLLESILNTSLKSHIGQTIDLLREEGVLELARIIMRKLGMNLKLMRWTIWTRVLLSFTLFLVIFFNQPYGLMEKTLRDHPHLGIGLKTAVLGSIVTMVVNDSGVVAMATLLFFPIFSIFYLILYTIHQESEEPSPS